MRQLNFFSPGGMTGTWCKTDSFGVFTEDVSITEQEIVLEDRLRQGQIKPKKNTQQKQIITDSVWMLLHLVVQHDFSSTVLWEENFLSDLHTDRLQVSFLNEKKSTNI